MYFKLLCFKKRRLNVCETPRPVFRFDGFAQVTQPLVCRHILFSKLFIFFSMTVFKRKIINQSVLTWLKILVIAFFFCAISEIQ